MKPKFRSLIAAFAPLSRSSLIVVASFCAVTSANAASQTWDGDTDATWATVTNWVSNTGAPGAVNPAAGSLSADTATFNAALVGGTRGGSTDPITYENARQVRHIAFDTDAGPFVFGTAGGNQLWLGHSGTITMSAAVASPQTFASSANFRLPSSTNGTYSITNNATSSSATLSFARLVSGSATSRPVSLSLGGTNTGENVIGGVTDNGALRVTKSGAGTWTVTGASVVTAQTDVGVAGGWEINGGILAAAHNSALGSLAGANSLGVAINATGTLEIRNGITLDNGLSLNLNNGGTIKAVGTTGTNGRINVGTAAAISVTLTTDGASDVFTIGNGTNDLTGGASDSVINVTGPGTVFHNVASNYAGKWQFHSGTTLLGSDTALGAAASASVSFGASSTAVLRTNGLNPTIVGLSTHAVPGTPIIENSSAASSVLTINNTTDDTYAGTLADGSTGTLGITKGGAGALTLSGTNTCTGGTLVNNGILKVNSAFASSLVTVNGGGTLGGTGALSGDVTVANLGHLAPGNSVGTLTVGSLTVESGAVLDYEFGSGNDLAVVSTSGGLTLNGGGLNLYQEGTTTQFSNVGNYNLIQYSGSLNGAVGNLSVLNPDSTKNYAFSATGSNVVLAITTAAISQWNLSTGGTWASAGSWSGAGIPNASGDTALFGSALASTGIVTLDGSKTVATVAFDNANSYTIAPATTETLNLDNTANSGQAQITGTNGSHQITAPISLNSNTVVSVANSGDTISLSGIISGNGNLTKSGPGSLVLSGANAFSGNVTISGGGLTFSSGSLSTGSQLSMGGSSLVWASGNTDDVSNAGIRTVEFLPGSITWNTNGNNVTVAGVVGNSGPGNLIKAGAGNLTLSGINSYSGTTTINSGALTINSDSSLGTAPGVVTPGSLVINSATLATTGTFTIAGNRGITLNSATSTVDAAAASNAICSAIIAGTGTLNVTGTGIFDLSATNTYSGGTVINTGATLNLSGNGTPGTGQVALAGGTLTLNRNLYNQGNIFVDAGQTGTVDGINDRVGISGLTGSGSITLVSRYAGASVNAGANGFRLFAGNGAFAGTVNLKSGVAATVCSFAAYFNGGGFDGNFSNATIHMTDNARLAGVNNSGGNTMTIGALSGDSTAILSGADYVATQTYNIGGKNLDTTFAGTINNGSVGSANISKSGTGKLTLTGSNTYGGTTTVNTGTLAVENVAALGLDTVGTTITGGDVDGRVTVTGGVTLTEPWTLGGRQGTNANSPHIVSLSGDNILSGLVTPATGGNAYNIQCDAGTLTVSGDFVPTGSVIGSRYLQIFGAGNGEWSGAIQNGTANVFVNLMSTGSWTFSGANDYTGDTTVESGATLVIASKGHLKFAPGANNVCNKVTGAGTATLNGIFDIDLTAANLTTNNEWTLVDVTSPTYGVDFAVAGFTESGSIWTKVDGANTWTFSQTSGKLGLTVAAGFSTWAAAHAGGGAATEDFDKDGVNNAAEWVLGGLETTNDLGKLPGVSTTGGNLIFTFERDQQSISADTTLTIETSTDLAGWPNSYAVPAVATPVGTVTVAKDTAPGKDTVTLTVPQSPDAKKFARLKVVITP